MKIKKPKKPMMTIKQHYWVRKVNIDKALDRFFEKPLWKPAKDHVWRQRFINAKLSNRDCK